MTGFGSSTLQLPHAHYSVEIRSVNNRYLKASIRLPGELEVLEAEIENHLRKLISRGSVTLTVIRRVSDAKAAHEVNDAAVLAYLDHLETIHNKLPANDRASVNIDLTALLALPGVLQPNDHENLLEEARGTLIPLIEQAVNKMIVMRLTEGQSVAADLAKNRAVITERLEIVRNRAPLVVEEYHTRLRTRMADLLARAELKINEIDLIREIAIFAERSDVSEEVTRLTAHLEHFEAITAGSNKEPAGRTLDFLSQEMLREANTIASKSNDAVISRAIVDVKGSIDRIKEQVQNIE